MHHFYRALAISGFSALLGCGVGDNLKSLSAADLETLLKGNTVEALRVKQQRPFKQYFGADGTTTQVGEEKRTGKWHIEGDGYCVAWDTTRTPGKKPRKADIDRDDAETDSTPKERCLSVKKDVEGAYRVFNQNNQHVLTFQKVVAGNPNKL